MLRSSTLLSWPLGRRLRLERWRLAFIERYTITAAGGTTKTKTTGSDLVLELLNRRIPLNS